MQLGVTHRLRLQRKSWIPMISEIQHKLAMSYKLTIAALEMTVKPRQDVVCCKDPPRNRENTGLCHSAYKTRNKTRVCKAIHMWWGVEVDEHRNLRTVAKHDDIVTDVRMRGEKI